MDETMIHASAVNDLSDYPNYPDFVTEFIDSGSHTLVKIGVFVRPKIQSFLEEMSKLF
jgi:hypothetical protein